MPRLIYPRYHWIRGWMIPIARLDLKEKEKNLSFVHPVAKLLYCLSYDASVSSKVNVYSMQNYSHVLSCCFV